MKTFTQLIPLVPLGAFATASLFAADASRLGKDLTPLGAETKASADGTIPAWNGGILTPPAN